MLVDFEMLTDDQQAEFVKGFMDADDLGVTDWASTDPWECPWFYAPGPEELDGVDAYEWGVSWFWKNRKEIKSLMKEKQKDESEEE